MKVRCETKVLADSLALVGSVVPARSPKPVLANVRLVAADGKLELHATDLEVGIRREVPVIEIEEPGEVLLPAAQANNIVREATAKEITLNAQDKTCTITYTGANYTIPCEAPEDFPEIPAFEEAGSITIEAKDLRQMIERTKFAAAREQARYALNGILFALKGETLRLVATDGRRLALVKGKAKNKATKEIQPIIPIKAMDLLDKLMTDPEEKVKVSIDENRVVALTKAGTLYSRLVEGHFPNYEEVIPKDCDRTLTIPATKLLSAIRRAALITSEESRSVKFSIKKDMLVLSTQTLEGRRATVEADGAKFDGAPIDIAFNPDFFVDMLKVVGDEEVAISFKDSASASLAKVGKDYSYIVMPVQLQEA